MKTVQKVKEVTLGQVREFLEQAKGEGDKSPRIHSKNTQVFLCHPHLVLTVGFHPLTIDYRKPLKQMMAEADAFNQEDFVDEEKRIARLEHFSKADNGITTSFFQLIEITEYNMDSQKARHYCEKRKVRPARIEEHIAFGQKYPDLFLPEFDKGIVAPGSLCQRNYSDRFEAPYAYKDEKTGLLRFRVRCGLSGDWNIGSYLLVTNE